MDPSMTGLVTARKQPVQMRSEATVGAILEAFVQVLLSIGYRKLTTTRVAERAGVSVGTLYQYFANRQALVYAVLESYLTEISKSLNAQCRSLAGCSRDEIATGLVDALIATKWQRIEVSRAMHEPLADVQGAELVRAYAKNGAACVADLLRTCSEIPPEKAAAAAVFLMLTCTSMLQAACIDDDMDEEMVRVNLRAMARGYLREIGTYEGSARAT